MRYVIKDITYCVFLFVTAYVGSINANRQNWDGFVWVALFGHWLTAFAYGLLCQLLCLWVVLDKSGEYGLKALDWCGNAIIGSCLHGLYG